MKLAVTAAVLSLGVAIVLAFAFFGEDQTVFMPGRTTDGHHQIEMSCDSCHTSEFASADDVQDACVDCHGAQLARSDDSHPRKKFTDPRNADRVAILDARYCVTCHREHVPDQTLAMGLTLQGDYCYRCHEDIGEERPSHAGLPFDGCAAGGCHNFHDNRSLYEDFLAKHQDEPAFLPVALVAATTGVTDRDARPLSIGGHDAPGDRAEAAAVEAWAASAHAGGGVNCSDCHGAAGSFEASVGLDTCRECHELQAEGFLDGRHGMRIARGLDPMTPAAARLPMQADAAELELTCNACHPAHAFDRRAAAVEACSGCHADEHTLAYADSPHASLFDAEVRGEAAAGSGVSCATCHLPRVEHDGGVHVRHDQNDTLRPNEKMARAVCLDCHGLGFALDALADADLVARNFRGRPTVHVESLEWVARRAR